MLKNYIKIAFRNLWKQKGYTIINVAGLAIGMTACLLILTYILNELSYDRFYEGHDNIYRIAFEGEFSGDFFNVAVSTGAMAGPAVEEFPEITHATRVLPRSSKILLSFDDKNIYQDNIYYVDSTFFDVFSFPFIYGEPREALTDPASVVLTRSVAEKCFPGTNPVGQTLRINNERNVRITGVIEDVPPNSHFQFNMLGSFYSFERNGRNPYEDWGSLNQYTYIRTLPGTDPDMLTEKFPEFLLRHISFLSQTDNIKFHAYLQPVPDIHLHSNLMAELSPNSDISYIYIFGTVAVIILVLACINFMNLTTAKSVRRAREVGIRKVAGAGKPALVFQFIGETVILSLIAMLLALGLAEVSMPAFNNLTSLDLSLSSLSGWQVALMLTGMVIFVGLFAGSYPAFYLSAFQPVKAIKGDLYKGKKRSILRNTLVVIQFTISIILMVSTFFVYYQMNYLKSKKLGYDEENVLVLPVRGENQLERYRAMKDELRSLPEIKSVASSLNVPSTGLDGSGYSPEGVPEDSPWIIYTIYGDFDFIDALGMNVVEGRGFDGSRTADSSSILINETLKQKLGWENPVGKHIYGFGGDSSQTLTVIGILQDYHFKSLHQPVEPAMIRINRGAPNYIVIRTNPGNLEQSVSKVEKIWDKHESMFPFDFFFLDQELDSQYGAEQKMSKIFIYFTILAVFIACLGLLGLASFSAEQRTKEIGIRKVLGASSTFLASMLVRDFIRWVVIANIIAWPLAWYFMQEWLNNFSYRISMPGHVWVFVAATFISLSIAILTVVFQAVRISVANPVDALKYE